MNAYDPSITVPSIMGHSRVKLVAADGTEWTAGYMDVRFSGLHSLGNARELVFEIDGLMERSPDTFGSTPSVMMVYPRFDSDGSVFTSKTRFLEQKEEASEPQVRGWSTDHAKFRFEGCEVVLEKDAELLYVHVKPDNAEMVPIGLDTRLATAINLLTSTLYRPAVVVRRQAGHIDTSLHSGPFKVGSALMVPPFGGFSEQAEQAWAFADKLNAATLRPEVHSLDVHPVLDVVNQLILASGQGLLVGLSAAAVAVEALATRLESLPTEEAEPDRIAAVDKILEGIAGIEGVDKPFLKMAGAHIENLRTLSFTTRLKRWAKNRSVPKDAVETWSKMRNKHLHGAAFGSVQSGIFDAHIPHEQKIRAFYTMLGLIYELLAAHAGTESVGIDLFAEEWSHRFLPEQSQR